MSRSKKIIPSPSQKTPLIFELKSVSLLKSSTQIKQPLSITFSQDMASFQAIKE